MALEIFHDVEQGSEAWHQLRAGIPTASRFADILAKGDGKMRLAYLYDLAGEIISGEPAESFENAAMRRGKRMEAQIRDVYELTCEEEIRQIGFARNGRVGCSPDSLAGDDGGLEIKTLNPRSLIPLLEKQRLQPNAPPPSEHIAQCQGNMWVTERKWWDLVIGYGRMPLYRKRIYREPGYIAHLETEVSIFTRDLDLLVERIRDGRMPAPKAEEIPQ